MEARLFTYQATNPHSDKPSESFRDTVLAVSRFDAQRRVEWMGLTNVRILFNGGKPDA
jgi:hypothetical protein